MLTDALLRKSNREQFLQSERMKGWRIDWQGTNRCLTHSRLVLDD